MIVAGEKALTELLVIGELTNLILNCELRGIYTPPPPPTHTHTLKVPHAKSLIFVFIHNIFRQDCTKFYKHKGFTCYYVFTIAYAFYNCNTFYIKCVTQV